MNARKRIAIVGSGGRLGAALVRNYQSAFEVIPFSRRQLDLNTPDSVPTALQDASFDVLINCAALTSVDYCETHEAEAMRVNAESVQRLGEVCAAKGVRCIHISTDYVFDGETPGLRTEEEVAKPISIYGMSKREGECRLIASGSEHLAVRVSWVFGPERPSFIDMIAKRALTESHLEAIDGKTSAPTYTEDFAGWLLPLLFEKPASGILHLCNQGETTWREYGQFALEQLAKNGVALQSTEVKGIPLSAMKNFVAERPVHTAMSTQKFTMLTGISPRSWHEAVHDYVQSYLVKRLAV